MELTQTETVLLIAGTVLLFYCIGAVMGYAAGYARGFGKGMERGMDTTVSAWTRGRHGPQGPTHT